MSLKRVNVAGIIFNLSEAEVAAVRKQLDRKPGTLGKTTFVALDKDGHVLGRGTRVEFISVDAGHEDWGLQLNLTDGTKDTCDWWYFGRDHYTIVTEEQFDALVEAGLAYNEEK